MKRIILSLGSIMLFANILFGILISAYKTHNIFLSSGVIILTTLFLLLADYLKIKDGFKIPFYLFNSILGFIEYIIAVFVKKNLVDNWGVIFLIVLLICQMGLIAIINTASKKI